MPAPKSFASVDDYISAQPEAIRSVLQRVRGAIHKALPSAAETISYHVPAYREGGSVILYFAAWKHYYSVYPANARVLAEFEDELAAHEVVKSTIHFAYEKPVPVSLLARIAKFREKEVAAVATRKRTGS